MRDYRGTVSTPDDTGSSTFEAETTHREALEQELLNLGGWLVEHRRATRKNLKLIKTSAQQRPCRSRGGDSA